MSDQDALAFPQGYPLWAVRACSIEDEEAEVGLVVGWEHYSDSSLRYPIVSFLGNHRTFRGIAFDWRSDVQDGGRGSRWVVHVELHATFDQAQKRASDLFRETCEHHDRLWPEDAPPPAKETAR